MNMTISAAAFAFRAVAVQLISAMQAQSMREISPISASGASAPGEAQAELTAKAASPYCISSATDSNNVSATALIYR